MAASGLVVDGCLDVETLIAEFAADASRVSLELPHMTTGQRKHARKVAEGYAELRCESYGYGQDRQLHLFKKEANCDVVQSKTADENAPNTKFLGAGKNDFPSKGKNLDQPECLSPGRSTNASCIDSSSDHSPASNDSDFSPLPERAQVKNTFIHFNTELGDSRNVQSMPHGMFRKCLLEESKARVETVCVTATGPLAHVEDVFPALAGTSIADDAEMLSSGTEVVIEGLTKAPAFNGRRGVIQSLDEETGRYTILLSSPGSTGGRQWAKVKRENIRLAAAPPPTFAPSLVLEDCIAPDTVPYDMPESPMWCETQLPLNLIAR